MLSCCRPAPPLWIADQVRNDVTMRCIVFTLTFDSSPIKGEGDWWLVWLVHPHPALWIDESPMNLCEILGFQPKGVATLSFSSRKRPAYAGMTVWWDCLAVTLTFDSSPIKGEGDSAGWIGLLSPAHGLPLWIDEFLITLCQRVHL